PTHRVMNREYAQAERERAEEEAKNIQPVDTAHFWGNILFNMVKKPNVTLKDVGEFFSDPEFAQNPDLAKNIVQYVGDDNRTILMELIANDQLPESNKVNIAALLLIKGVDIDWQGDISM